MITRVFLAVVGAAYLALAGWCVAQPTRTANSVGFELLGGSGRSEYFVVYGGLQLGLGLIFLWPLAQPHVERFSLTSCLVIHLCLVIMRCISFGVFSGIGTTTYFLAATEWLILLASVWRYFAAKP